MLRLGPTGLPSNVIEEIMNGLKIQNPAKKRAEKEMLYRSADIPEYIELWNWDRPSVRELGIKHMVLPRGFKFDLEEILKKNNVEANWIDKTSFVEKHIFDNDIIPLRDYQLKAADRMIEQLNGIYKSSTGSGKSRVMLALVRACQQKTIVFCEKTDIQDQWIKFANELGFDSVGEIGDGSWEDGKNLTIALRQSVWARGQSERRELNDSWYKQFGMVIWDEAHHVQASTAFDLIQRFPARYRFGCSATPDSDPDLFPIISAAIGPIVVSTPIKEIGKHLVIPSVRVIKTEFEFDYRPTLRLKNGRVERNNYSEMMFALEKDQDRNELIINKVLEECWGGSDIGQCLILSKRKEHLSNLLKIFLDIAPTIFNGPIQFLTGDNSNEISKISCRIDKNNYEGSVLFSTLAEEGTDIPKLDRLFLTYPGRKLRGYEQAIGRIMRPHPKKKDAIVYDFRDANVSLLNSQFRSRCQMYHKNSYEVDMGD